MQHVYSLNTKTTVNKKMVQQGVQLFTDNLSSENQVGILDDPTSLLGGTTFLDEDTFQTPLTYENVRFMGRQSTTSLVVSAGGILALPLIAGSEFRFEHNEDIRIDITGALAGQTHTINLKRVKDDSATPRFNDWSSLTIGGVAANVEFSDGAEPVLTQTAKGYDAHALYINGLNVVVGTVLNKGSDGGSVNLFDPNSVLVGTPVSSKSPSYSTLYSKKASVVRQATEPILVEGDSEVGALVVFGSQPNLVKSSAVRILGDVISAFNSTVSVNQSSSETSHSVATSAGTLTIDCLEGRMVDFLHDVDNLDLILINAPTGNNEKRNVQLLRIQENTASIREINWDSILVNGVNVPVVWQDSSLEFLTQAADAQDIILLSVYSGYVEARIHTNWS